MRPIIVQQMNKNFRMKASHSKTTDIIKDWRCIELVTLRLQNAVRRLITVDLLTFQVYRNESIPFRSDLL